MKHTSKPLEPVDPPVNSIELAEWLRLDDNSDPVLDRVLIMATASVIEYLQRELITRSRLLTFKEWPECGTKTSGLSRETATLAQTVELPYSYSAEILGVTVYGQVFTDYKLHNELAPCVLEFCDIPYQFENCDDDAIQIQYDAGYGDYNLVPEQIKSAILMLAGYIYDKRGSCDMPSAIQDSGASQMLTPYMNHVITV